MKVIPSNHAPQSSPPPYAPHSQLGHRILTCQCTEGAVLA